MVLAPAPMLMVQKDRYFGPGSHAVCSFTEFKTWLMVQHSSDGIFVNQTKGEIKYKRLLQAKLGERVFLGIVF